MMDLTIWLAFSAGFLSFLSPCCFPLYPSFLSYLTGVSIQDDTQTRRSARTILLHASLFLLGFSVIFIALGFSASLVGDLFWEQQDLVRQVGAIFVMAMGLVMLGLFQPAWLMRERRMRFMKKPAGYGGSILLGLTYAAGWTPCIGPIFTAILALGVSRPQEAIWYMIFYVLGFALPFLSLAFWMTRMKWIVRYSGIVMKVGGGLMLLTGILLYTDQMTEIMLFFIRIFGGFSGF